MPANAGRASSQRLRHIRGWGWQFSVDCKWICESSLVAEIAADVSPYAVLSLTVIRMLPVALAPTGAGMRLPTLAYIGWFGPRGLASVVFGLLLVEDQVPDIERLGQVIAATIGLSILLHGMSAPYFANRYGNLDDAAKAATPDLRRSQRHDGRLRRTAQRLPPPALNRTAPQQPVAAPTVGPPRSRTPVAACRKRQQTRRMVIALLAVLGVDLLTIAVLLGLVIARKRWARRQPGAFNAAIRTVQGDVPGLASKWRRGYRRWVRGVLVWERNPFLFRNLFVPAGACPAPPAMPHRAR